MLKDEWVAKCERLRIELHQKETEIVRLKEECMRHRKNACRAMWMCVLLAAMSTTLCVWIARCGG